MFLSPSHVRSAIASTGLYLHREQLPWMTLNIKIEFFMDFRRFWAAIHISRANCAEINTDKQGQAAYEIFSIEHRFQQSKSRFSRFKETRARRHQRVILP